MNKLLLGSLIMVSAMLLSTSTVFAGGGCGGGGVSRCPSSAKYSSVSEETLKKFNDETADLNARLSDLSSEIEKEYAKDQPDLDVVAKLQKDIVDVQVSIQKIAVKYGIPSRSASCGVSKASCHNTSNPL